MVRDRIPTELRPKSGQIPAGIRAWSGWTAAEIRPLVPSSRARWVLWGVTGCTRNDAKDNILVYEKCYSECHFCTRLCAPVWLEAVRRQISLMPMVIKIITQSMSLRGISAIGLRSNFGRIMIKIGPDFGLNLGVVRSNRGRNSTGDAKLASGIGTVDAHGVRTKWRLG